MEMTPLKAIKEKCLDCCCGDKKEVELCTIERCPLYKFRFGVKPKDESKPKKQLSEADRKKIAERLQAGRTKSKEKVKEAKKASGKKGK